MVANRKLKTRAWPAYHLLREQQSTKLRDPWKLQSSAFDFLGKSVYVKQLQPILLELNRRYP